MKARDMWNEVIRRFGKENSLKTPSEFCSDRFALFIERLSVQVWDLEKAGLKLAHLAVQKFGQFHQYNVNAKWNRASSFQCKDCRNCVNGALKTSRKFAFKYCTEMC